MAPRSSVVAPLKRLVSPGSFIACVSSVSEDAEAHEIARSPGTAGEPGCGVFTAGARETKRLQRSGGTNEKRPKGVLGTER